MLKYYLRELRAYSSYRGNRRVFHSEPLTHRHHWSPSSSPEVTSRSYELGSGWGTRSVLTKSSWALGFVLITNAILFGRAHSITVKVAFTEVEKGVRDELVDMGLIPA